MEIDVEYFGFTALGGRNAKIDPELARQLKACGFTVVKRHVALTDERPHKREPIGELVQFLGHSRKEHITAFNSHDIVTLSDITRVKCMDVWGLLKEGYGNYDFLSLCSTLHAAELSFADVAIQDLWCRSEKDWATLGLPQRYGIKLVRHGIIGPPMLLSLSTDDLKGLRNIGPKAITEITALQERLR